MQQDKNAWIKDQFNHFQGDDVVHNTTTQIIYFRQYIGRSTRHVPPVEDGCVTRHSFDFPGGLSSADLKYPDPHI